MARKEARMCRLIHRWLRDAELHRTLAFACLSDRELHRKMDLVLVQLTRMEKNMAAILDGIRAEVAAIGSFADLTTIRMKIVKATREGLSGRHTATGLVIDKDGIPMTQDDWFCALPSTRAKQRVVRIINPANALEVTCPVLDVGPWNEHDDEYVFGPARPAAEGGIDTRGRVTNRAGIDLSDGVWKTLGMVDNTEVLWEFV